MGLCPHDLTDLAPSMLNHETLSKMHLMSIFHTFTLHDPLGLQPSCKVNLYFNKDFEFQWSWAFSPRVKRTIYETQNFTHPSISLATHSKQNMTFVDF